MKYQIIISESSLQDKINYKVIETPCTEHVHFQFEWNYLQLPQMSVYNILGLEIMKRKPNVIYFALS